VRKRVWERVEKEAADAGKSFATISEVKATQKRYLSGITSEIKGYQLDTCFGPGVCPNRAYDGDDLLRRIEALEIVKACINLYKKKSTGGKRFAEILHDEDLIEIEERFSRTPVLTSSVF